MNAPRKQALSKKGRQCRSPRIRSTQDQVDERDVSHFAREANRRESAALDKYGLAAYEREELRRDERGHILR